MIQITIKKYNCSIINSLCRLNMKEDFSMYRIHANIQLSAANQLIKLKIGLRHNVFYLLILYIDGFHRILYTII